MLEAGVGALEPDLAELLTRTFLRPTSNQQRVAVALHLSFNTYRRHRDKAVEQLTARLWCEFSQPPSAEKCMKSFKER